MWALVGATGHRPGAARVAQRPGTRTIAPAAPLRRDDRPVASDPEVTGGPALGWLSGAADVGIHLCRARRDLQRRATPRARRCQLWHAVAYLRCHRPPPMSVQAKAGIRFVGGVGWCQSRRLWWTTTTSPTFLLLVRSRSGQPAATRRLNWPPARMGRSLRTPTASPGTRDHRRRLPLPHWHRSPAPPCAFAYRRPPSR